MTLPPAPEPVRFSTVELPERDRLPAFREEFGRAVVGVDFAPLSDSPFQADMSLVALPGLQMLSSRMSASRHERTRGLIADGNDDIYVVTVGKAGLVRQLDHEVVLGEGDAVLMRACNVSTFMFPETTACLGLRVAYHALAPLTAELDEAFVRPIACETDALRLLIDYASLIGREHALASPDVIGLGVTHVHDLLALAIGANSDGADIARQRGLRAARLHAAKTYILENLGRCDLTIGEAAARQRVTPRYIQMLFESEGTTFSAFVRDKRLARSRTMLCDPRAAHLSIAEVAYLAGFGDLSTYNRAFRYRFGMTPRDARHASPDADTARGQQNPSPSHGRPPAGLRASHTLSG